MRTSEYLTQVLPHCATLRINNVVYVVETGGSMVEGSVLYKCSITFCELLRRDYKFTMECTWTSAFSWIGTECKKVP